MAVDSKEVKTVEVPEDSETQAEERSSRVTPKWFKRITRNGDVYNERSTDVTEEIRKEGGESDVTRSIMDKYNKQFAPKKAAPKKAAPVSRYKEITDSNDKKIMVPKTAEDDAIEKDAALQKSKARTNNYVGRISKSGRVYYAAATGGNAEWQAMRRRQAAAYNRARRNAK